MVICMVEHDDKDEKLGPPVALTSAERRRMFNLANASFTDIFYDLGCGYGENCFTAVREFKVTLAVGIEKDRERYQEALRRRKKLPYSLRKRVRILPGSYLKRNLKPATIVYNGLDEMEPDLRRYKKMLRKNGCKLITVYTPLIGVKIKDKDYPFYLMITPFQTISKDEWISQVISIRNKTNESIYRQLVDYCNFTSISYLKQLFAKRF